MKITDLLKKDAVSLNQKAADQNAVIDLLVGLHDKAGNLNDKAAYKEAIEAGFITDASDWTAAHKYIAFLTTEATTVTAADFAGLWVKFILDSAADIAIADAGNHFSGNTVETALQEVGETLAGLEQLFREI